jgi:hypothetical protein
MARTVALRRYFTVSLHGAGRNKESFLTVNLSSTTKGSGHRLAHCGIQGEKKDKGPLWSDGDDAGDLTIPS